VRIVLDTCVIVSAFRSQNGASRALINAFDRKEFNLLLSTALLLEYEDVLSRQEQMLVHGFSLREIAEFLDTMADRADRAVRVSPHFKWNPQLRDPGDEHVLATAINGNADLIVTHNITDFLPVTLNFGIQVMTPGRIMRERFLT